MARVKGIELLQPLQVWKARDSVSLVDGRGLTLKITDGSCRAVFRYTSPAGARREMGMGLVDRSTQARTGESLIDLRERAEDARRLLRQGIDPIEAKHEARAQAKASVAAKKVQAKAEATTLARYARHYHALVIEGKRSPKHAAQWISSLERLVPPKMWHAPIDTITGDDMLAALGPLQDRLPETAGRVFQRLEKIFRRAESKKLIPKASNPATLIKDELREQAKPRERGEFAALDYSEVPAFLAQLREQPGTGSLALQFALLTAARTGEVLGATWREINVDARLWTIPAKRMKGGTDNGDHKVYLTDQSLAVLATVRRLDDDICFPSPMIEHRPMSNMAMLVVLRRMGVADRTTVHGVCRASFSSWAYESAGAREEVVEACLAHKEADRVKASYNRATFAADRAALLKAWADYITSAPAPSNVVPLTRESIAA